jgi:hypothetical protein
MGTRNQRTARRFQVEALETRWTPGGLSGGVLGEHGAASQVQVAHIGEEIPQVQVAHIGEEIPQVQVAHPVAYGSKIGIGSGAN